MKKKLHRNKIQAIKKYKRVNWKEQLASVCDSEEPR